MRLTQGSNRLQNLTRPIAIACISLIHFSAMARPGDTLKSFLAFRHPPGVYPVKINHYEDRTWMKVKRGTLYAFTYNVAIGAGLSLASEQVTQWNKKDKFNIEAITEQYKTSSSF